VLLVDSWLIPVRSIGGLFNRFLDVCEVLLCMFVILKKSRDEFVGYVYFDYAGDLDKWRYFIGYVFIIGICVVSCKVSSQKYCCSVYYKAKYMTH
jgi:hypothetical protein